MRADLVAPYAPVIIKLIEGSQGAGVILAQTAKAAEAIADTEQLFFDNPFVFEGKRFVAARQGLAPDERKRPPPSRPICAEPGVMLAKPLLEFVRVPCIERAIGAAQKINPEVHGCGERPSTMRFALRSGRASTKTDTGKVMEQASPLVLSGPRT